jgi:hypothetical protein
MQQELDWGSFRLDIAAIAREIIGLKRTLGSTWHKPMADEQRELGRLKARATELCCLRAFSRGRLHILKPPRACTEEWDAVQYHRRIVERLGPTYALAVEQSA